jgi:hypothetical protein
MSPLSGVPVRVNPAATPKGEVVVLWSPHTGGDSVVVHDEEDLKLLEKALSDRAAASRASGSGPPPAGPPPA